MADPCHHGYKAQDALPGHLLNIERSFNIAQDGPSSQKHQATDLLGQILVRYIISKGCFICNQLIISLGAGGTEQPTLCL